MSKTLEATSLSGGSVELSTPDLNAGGHQIKAIYMGDANYLGSGSYTADDVQTAPTTTVLSSDHENSAEGQLVTFTATVTPASGSDAMPTGSVEFYDEFDNETTDMGSAVVDSNGESRFFTSDLPVGDQQITADYGGDNNYAGSTSAPVDQHVTAVSPTGTLTIYDDSGSPLNSPASGVVFMTPGGDSRVKMTIQESLPAGCQDTIELDYCEHLVVYDAGGDLIESDTPVTDGETVYVGGMSASDFMDDSNVTLLDMKPGGSSTNLDQVNFTAVDVSMKSITFTSDYRTYVPGPGGSPELQNGVREASDLGSDGEAVGSTDWSSDNPGVSHAIAQKMGTALSLTFVIDVQPAQFQYTISSMSWSLDDTADSYLNFTSQSTTASGGDDSINLTSNAPLPNVITQLNQGVLWTINDGNKSFAQNVATTTHEIFVTYDNPKTDSSNGYNFITDQRLQKAIDIRYGETDEYGAALTSQQWSATNLAWTTVRVEQTAQSPSTIIGNSSAGSGVFKASVTNLEPARTHPENPRHRRDPGTPVRDARIDLEHRRCQFLVNQP